MRVCPECGTRYGDQAGFCPMDGSRLGDVSEAKGTAVEVVQPSAPVERKSAADSLTSGVPTSAWSGFGSWPAGLGPAPSPVFAPPPLAKRAEPIVVPSASASASAPVQVPVPAPVQVPVLTKPPSPAIEPVIVAPAIQAPAIQAPAPVIAAPVIAAPVVAAPTQVPIEVPIPIERPPSAPQPAAPVHTREPTMRWQPSASGSRPVPQAGVAWTAAAAAMQPESAPAPEPPAEPPGWQRPAWLAVAPVDDGEPEEELIGRVLGDRYRVDERIGSGGMGVVYRATHVLIGKRVAIKVLRRRFARQTDVAQRFAQEARVASSIKHINVVDINDFGTTPGGSPFCVMEHLDGHNLAREIDRTGRLEPGLAIDIAIQVARGLAAAHHAHVVHRDLKPDNVFLVPGEREGERTLAIAKILDFGIARVAGGKARLTAAGSVIGTPEYMSPEQARGDEVDARSDLYALGVMLFEALTGCVPLQGDTLAGTLTKQVFEAPPKLRDIDPRLDGLPNLEAVLTRLLAKSRDDRPHDALAVVRLLQVAATHDLGRPQTDPRGQATLEDWSPGASLRSEAPRTRRSTIMIGSGAITSAHTAVRVGDGPATGDFDAKDVDDPDHGKRPSVIIRDGSPVRAPASEGTPVRSRPARIVGQTRSDLIGPGILPGASAPPPPVDVIPRTRTPTPEPEPSDEVRRRKRNRARRQQLPVVLLAAGAAVFAALATIGFVQWWQRKNVDTTSESTEGARE